MRRLSVLLGVTEELAERVASSALEGDSVSPVVSLPAPGEEFLLVLVPQHHDKRACFTEMTDCSLACRWTKALGGAPTLPGRLRILYGWLVLPPSRPADTSRE